MLRHRLKHRERVQGWRWDRTRARGSPLPWYASRSVRLIGLRWTCVETLADDEHAFCGVGVNVRP